MKGWGDGVDLRKNLLLNARKPQSTSTPNRKSLCHQVFKEEREAGEYSVTPRERRGDASGIKQSLFIFKLPAQGFQKSLPKCH